MRKSHIKSQCKYLSVAMLSILSIMICFSFAYEETSGTVAIRPHYVAIKTQEPCDGIYPVRNDILFNGSQELIKKAYIDSGCDKNFIYLLDCENDSWDMGRQSDIILSGVREDSWGLCQINTKWHKRFVYHEDFFRSESFQIEACMELFNGGTKFGCRGDLSKKDRITFMK